MKYPNFTDEEVSRIFDSIPEEVLYGKQGMKKKYSSQKSDANAGFRAPMKLSFKQWAVIWFESGHWAERGRHKGCYQMCRRDDAGPYEMGNVRIDTQQANLKERKHSDTFLASRREICVKFSKPLIATHKISGFETEFPSACEAARQLNANQGAISNAAHGKLKTAYGYYWRFK